MKQEMLEDDEIMRNIERDDISDVREKNNNWKKEMGVKRKARWDLVKSLERKASLSEDVKEKDQTVYKQ